MQEGDHVRGQELPHIGAEKKMEKEKFPEHKRPDNTYGRQQQSITPSSNMEVTSLCCDYH